MYIEKRKEEMVLNKEKLGELIINCERQMYCTAKTIHNRFIWFRVFFNKFRYFIKWLFPPVLMHCINPLICI